jgi:alpha-1,3-glucosyltransferase
MACLPRWIVGVALLGLALRWLLAYHPHSGLNVPPMLGDFEAQRHWVEITNGLPPAEWYRNGTDNDLQYWGLDYPPLSAWHAKLIYPVAKIVMGALPGSVTSDVDAALVQAFGLHVSRGSEDRTTITIMRASALATDVLFYVLPALWLLLELRWCVGAAQAKAVDGQRRSRAVATARAVSTSRLRRDDVDEFGGSGELAPDWTTVRDDAGQWWTPYLPATTLQAVAVALLLVPPAQCYIDHGHFQFNAAAIGPGVVACAAIAVRVSRIEASIAAKVQGGTAGRVFAPAYLDMAFCAIAAASIMFKQMSLYFSMGFTAHMLDRFASRATESRGSLRRGVESVVAGAAGGFGVLAACLAPPLIASDVLTRMFPFARGLYEDKVANVWCAASVVVKLPSLIPAREHQVRFCAAPTLLAALPAVLLYVRRRPPLIRRRRPDPTSSVPLDHAVRFALVLAASSLSFFLFSYQVHEKGIMMPAGALTVAAAIAVLKPSHVNSRFVDGGSLLHAAVHFHAVALFSMAPLAHKDAHMSIPFVPVFIGLCVASSRVVKENPAWRWRRVLTRVSMAVMTAILVIDLVYEPPARFPDIVSLLYAIVGCAHFLFYLGLCWLWLARSD